VVSETGAPVRFGPDHNSTTAINETKLNIEEPEVHVWTAPEAETFKIVDIEADLDALLFIKQVLKRCRGDPVVPLGRGLWYYWVLDDLDLCESRREMWRGRVSGRSVVLSAEISKLALLQPVPPQ
jgi:hypothetical protein